MFPLALVAVDVVFDFVFFLLLATVGNLELAAAARLLLVDVIAALAAVAAALRGVPLWLLSSSDDDMATRSNEEIAAMDKY